MESGPSNSANFNAYNGRLQSSALNATRRAAVFPSDITFHRSMDHELAEELDSFSERVLSIANKLLSLVGTLDQTQSSKSKGKAKVEGEDDVVDNFYSIIVDATDQLLERTDICLDDVLGKNKAPAIAINTPIQDAKKSGLKTTKTGRSEPVIQHAAHLVKPQLSFRKRHDNSDSPWYPTISHKYNAKVPLGHVYCDPGTDNTAATLSNHPYHYEITHISYPARMFTPCNPLPPPALEETTAIWITTSEAFQAMFTQLRKATEIAVDLEHHSYRSYAGFLCLMQISDRERDWVVDLLAVRNEIETLNEVFTDPGIVKVFHGADSDIVWLQQDFNVHVVNLFDTFHASKLLEFPQHGLAHLLEMYCDFIPDKRYQLADWRIRPLPDNMLRYARSDTHFLLFIYDHLRNALLDRSKSKSRSSTPPPAYSSSASSPSRTALLDEALARSAETSLKVYTKEPYDAVEGSGTGGWDTLAKRWNKIALTAGGPGVGVGGMQREVYKSVHWWRERVAREEDESTRYVLPNHSLFLIAEQPPADMAVLLALFKSTVPPVVKKRMKELLSVIRDAVKRAISSSKPGVSDVVCNTESKAGKEFKAWERQDEVVMLDTEIKNLESENNNQVLNIWGVKANETASSSRSSLFGSSFPAKSSSTTTSPPRSSFAAGVSSLFGRKGGNLVRQKSTRDQVLLAGSSTFVEVVTKINRSLNMAPDIPQLIPLLNDVQALDEPKQDTDVALGMQVEIPYVPASQRPVKVEEKDTIVVVGQARQKRKRKTEKRRATEADTIDGTPPTPNQDDALMSKDKKGKQVGEESQEPFDFSSVPNILDADPDAVKGKNDDDDGEADKRRKRQKKTTKKKGIFYGDFPAPPKAHSELKSGNKSYTFK